MVASALRISSQPFFEPMISNSAPTISAEVSGKSGGRRPTIGAVARGWLRMLLPFGSRSVAKPAPRSWFHLSLARWLFSRQKRQEAPR